MIRINLLQREGEKKVEAGLLRSRKFWFTIGGCVVAVVVLLAIFRFGLIGGKRVAMVPSPPEVVEKEEPRIDDRTRFLLGAEQDGIVYASILGDIEQAIPNFIWLTSISLSHGEAFFIEGVGFSFSRIKKFRDRLEQSPLLLDVKIPLIRKGEFDGSGAFKFTIGGRVIEKEVTGEEPLKGKPLFAKGELKGLLAEIERIGSENGLTALWLKAGGERTEKYFNKIVVKGGMRGSYHQMRKFMDQLISLDELVSPAKLIITPPAWEEGPPSDEVRFAFDLNIYLARE